jgi:hypothetical protein
VCEDACTHVWDEGDGVNAYGINVHVPDGFTMIADGVDAYGVSQIQTCECTPAHVQQVAEAMFFVCFCRCICSVCTVSWLSVALFLYYVSLTEPHVLHHLMQIQPRP